MSTTLKRVIASLVIILFLAYAMFRLLPIVMTLVASPILFIVGIIVILSLIYGLIRLVMAIK